MFKSFLDKFSSHTSRYEFFYLSFPFILWVICFWHFFTGRLLLYEDAISYANHICFYADNLSRGVYPLWDPTWFNGASNDFFLRRMGDVNPFFILILILKGFGLPGSFAYLIFLGFYYFLAGWSLYLITRLLLKDHFCAFLAYLLFLYSSWSTEIFYNYIIIIFVPVVWFFYFLLCFAQRFQKGHFLGMCLCLGLLVTTYIPFFFITILTVFILAVLVFYGKEFVGFMQGSLAFVKINKIFSVFCVFFLLAACVPGALFYKDSKAGEFVLPNRHAGAKTASEVTVSMEHVKSGDFISHGFFDRLFADHAHLDMGDIYLPFIFFLILLVTIPARVNKLIFFLLFNILALFLVTVTTASGLHRFLYEHLMGFKFIRNIYYFFWLGILPAGLLLAMTALKSLFSCIEVSGHKIKWLFFIIAAHVIFVLFLLTHQGLLWTDWLAVILSLIYFIVLILYDRKISCFLGFLLVLLAVFIQSIPVYSSLQKQLFQLEKFIAHYEDTHQVTGKHKIDLYYASHWFGDLVNHIDPEVFDGYCQHLFIFYDILKPYDETPNFYTDLQNAMKAHANLAFVPRADTSYIVIPAKAGIQNNMHGDMARSFNADFDPVALGELTVLKHDSNTWILKTHLSHKEFLVINDNYHSHWHAFVNGQEVHLFRANGSFKGLWVPAGESKVVLRFGSFGRYFFHYSLIILFFGVLIGLVALFIIYR
ncbi:MAG: hypothetical protein HQL13_00850 [Candidatus Omnitrophica bacterium]|nr:hypothetical protein [Candidatus Omnitrophota bacterium]